MIDFVISFRIAFRFLCFVDRLLSVFIRVIISFVEFLIEGCSFTAGIEAGMFIVCRGFTILCGAAIVFNFLRLIFI